ncbi:MAG: four helix bundle protein [Verrucomicrobia bacterium]|nr:MAG: four helix bundle protein [Verrucomicrobiota bacterium]
MSYKVTKDRIAKRENAATAQVHADDGKRGFQTFEDLEVYKVAREFRKAMYAVNRRLPDFEKYELGSQIRRASASLTNNMAEGHGRFHYPDQIRFFLHSRGSLEELVDDLNICLDERYLSSEEVAKLKKQARGVLILINGYLRYLRSRSSSVRESDGADSNLIDELDNLLPL